VQAMQGLQVEEHPTWWREAPNSVRAGVYVSQANGSGNGIVFGYGAQNRKNKAPLCSIGNQRLVDSDIASDTLGNVDVPDFTTSNINVYAPHCGKLLARIHDPYGAGSDVTVHGSTVYSVGTQHVAICTRQGCSNELTDASIFQLETAAIDSNGNVWASYYDQNARISLIVWKAASMPGHRVSGYVNNNTPGGLLFDNNGNLVSVQTRFFHVYVYQCNAASASCTNTATFTLKGGSLFGALNAANTDIQVTDYPNTSVDVYTYPGFTYEYSYDRGLLQNYGIEGITQTR
jgi:hypothetical protein